jgi:hypothetical protein
MLEYENTETQKIDSSFLVPARVGLISYPIEMAHQCMAQPVFEMGLFADAGFVVGLPIAVAFGAYKVVQPYIEEMLDEDVIALLTDSEDIKAIEKPAKKPESPYTILTKFTCAAALAFMAVKLTLGAFTGQTADMVRDTRHQLFDPKAKVETEARQALVSKDLKTMHYKF